jgi:hypothetical protein
MSLRITVLCLCFGFVASPLFAANHERCGTRIVTDAEATAIEQQLAQKGRKPTASISIQTWVHVISKGTGVENGDVPSTSSAHSCPS